jgi:DNA-binding NarL/FixJ family response regulator
MRDHEIAHTLAITVRTVKSHLENIFHKLELARDPSRNRRIMLAMEVHRRFPDLCNACCTGESVKC